jgi:hypothetical protein
MPANASSMHQLAVVFTNRGYAHKYLNRPMGVIKVVSSGSPRQGGHWWYLMCQRQ